jgi:hypothetical protein
MRIHIFSSPTWRISPNFAMLGREIRLSFWQESGRTCGAQRCGMEEICRTSRQKAIRQTGIGFDE